MNSICAWCGAADKASCKITKGCQQDIAAKGWGCMDHTTEQEQTRQAIIDLAWKECGVQGDAIRQLATTLVTHGYRKFEIVEEDV